MGKITYRHNIMDVGSLDTFFSIRGGFNNQTRDVYFIRALGECADYRERIAGLERRAGAEASDGRLRYTRICALENPVGDCIQKYAAVYDTWKRNGRIDLDCIAGNEGLGRTVADALARAEDVYREAGANRSPSMLKNFSIKLLFWMEEKAGPLLSAWNERACMKIVLENVAKEQEYLFGYFLTLLGCDVLLLENRCDVNVSEALKRFSGVMTLGGFGSTELTPYVQTAQERQENRSAAGPVSRAGRTPQVQEEPESRRAAGAAPYAGRMSQAQEKPRQREAVRVVIPAHAGRKPQSPPQAARMPETATQRAAVDTSRAAGFPQAVVRKESAAGISRTAGRAEKTFEELAQMASSIVMIADHDRRGEVVGTGSGIMIGRNGYILTNHHVIAAGRSYSVRIEDDGQIYETDEIIKYNQALDLAVIRIQRALSPLAIYRGPERLVRGQRVVAIGSPLGLFNSVSDGIISGFRNINETDMIQFTAPISPGSSGGAVLNMFGEVIGISTAGFDSGQNINLAVGYEDIRMFARGFFDA